MLQDSKFKMETALPRPIVWATVVIALALGFLLLYFVLDEPIGDEAVHAFQISWFLQGIYEQFQYVTVYPVYHAANAALTFLLGGDSLALMRFSSMCLGALSIPAFAFLVRHFNPDLSASRTLLFVLLPIYFPLFFLVYTDVFALALVLLMVERTLAGSYKLAGLFAMAAAFSRQPNLVWLGYCAFLVLLDSGKIEFSISYVRTCLQRLWPYLLAAVIFLSVVIWQGGIVRGDTEQHGISFNLSNFYFFLLIAFGLFAPYCISRAAALYSFLLERRWVMLLLAGLFVVYMNTWELTHIYNDRSLAYYLHNLVLNTINDHMWLKVISFILMAWMALVIIIQAMDDRHNRALAWLLPFAFLSVVPLPLIEQRYYLVPVCLLLAMLPPISRNLFVITCVYYLLGAGFFLYNISLMNFFL